MFVIQPLPAKERSSPYAGVKAERVAKERITHAARVTELLRKRGPKAASADDIIKITGMAQSKVWNVLHRLECDGIIARFTVDGQGVACLKEFEAQAYYEVAPVVDPDIRRLYAAFGTKFPAKIRRSKPVVSLEDDDKPAWTRYAEKKGVMRGLQNLHETGG